MPAVMIASAKGGVGKSTLTVGLGKNLAENGKRILLIDMDIGVRSLDLLLKVAENTVYNWGDVLLNNCDPFKAIINVSENLSLLPAPVALNESFKSEDMKNLVEFYKSNFDFILLDSPAGIETGFNLSLNASDKCIIVSTPDPISIRAASAASLSVKKQGITDVRLVLNRFNKKQYKNICVDDIIDTVSARFLGIVPESTEISFTAIGEELPFDSKGNLAYLRIAKRLIGENIPFRIKNI